MVGGGVGVVEGLGRDLETLKTVGFVLGCSRPSPKTSLPILV